MRPDLGGKVRGFVGGVDCWPGVGMGEGEGRAERRLIRLQVSQARWTKKAEFAS